MRITAKKAKPVTRPRRIARSRGGWRGEKEIFCPSTRNHHRSGKTRIQILVTPHSNWPLSPGNQKNAASTPRVGAGTRRQRASSGLLLAAGIGFMG